MSNYPRIPTEMGVWSITGDNLFHWNILSPAYNLNQWNKEKVNEIMDRLIKAL